MADFGEAEAVSCDHKVIASVLDVWSSISVPLERPYHFVLDFGDGTPTDVLLSRLLTLHILNNVGRW